MAADVSGLDVHRASAEPTPGEREGPEGVQAGGAPVDVPDPGGLAGAGCGDLRQYLTGGTPILASPKRLPASRNEIPGSGVGCAAIGGSSGVGGGIASCVAGG